MPARHLYHLFYKLSLTKTTRDLFLYYHSLEMINIKRTQKHRVMLFRKYKSYRMLLRLKNWKIKNEANSLIQIANARKPKNPE
jgi:hypothetical protein